MKIKEGFMLCDVAGSHVVLPMGQETADFNGMITLNETGVFLWKQLEKGCTREKLLAAMQEEYDVTEERAAKGIEKFLAQVKENNFVED